MDGTFQFEDVPAGDYVIEASCQGYESGRLELTNWSSSDMRPIVVTLGRPIAHDEPPVGPDTTTTVEELRVPSKAMKELSKAQNKSRQQDFEGAIGHLKKALEVYPAHAGAWNNLGVAYMKTGRDPEAESAFKTALSNDAHCLQALRNLGLLYFSQDKNREAIEPLRASLEKDAVDYRAQTYLAVALYREGRYSDSEAWLLKALDVNPDFTDAVYQLALVQFKLKDYQGASGSVDRYLASAPGGEYAERLKQLKVLLDKQVTGSGE
jgi:tetratricopeptide (TPR) repeat protein